MDLMELINEYYATRNSSYLIEIHEKLESFANSYIQKSYSGTVNSIYVEEIMMHAIPMIIKEQIQELAQLKKLIQNRYGALNGRNISRAWMAVESEEGDVEYIKDPERMYKENEETFNQKKNVHLLLAVESICSGLSHGERLVLISMLVKNRMVDKMNKIPAHNQVFARAHVLHAKVMDQLRSVSLSVSMDQLAIIRKCYILSKLEGYNSLLPHIYVLTGLKGLMYLSGVTGGANVVVPDPLTLAGIFEDARLIMDKDKINEGAISKWMKLTSLLDSSAGDNHVGVSCMKEYFKLVMDGINKAIEKLDETPNFTVEEVKESYNILIKSVAELVSLIQSLMKTENKILTKLGV